MPQYGVYANRNAGHKKRRALLFGAAKTDAERLVAAFDWFRSSTRLLARRRAPKGIGKEVHSLTAARLVREMTDYLKSRAEAIDRGDYDAKKVTVRDDAR